MHSVPERKLTTILAADVAGYSAMMDRDEAGTLAQLRASRETLTAEIARYRGRVFGASGDSLLAEFASVVNAVECAVRMQRTLEERNATLPEAKRMRFRIGINLGDVIVEGDDLLGDGVNIAARLQALAEPGGVLISGSVFEQVRKKLALGFDFLGPQPVKNISEPVPAWRVVLDPDVTVSQGEKAAAKQPDEGMGRSVSSRAASGATSHPPASQASSPYGKGQPQAKPLWQRVRRSVVLAGVLIGFLLMIDLLASDHALWFYWPALVILFLLGIRVAFALGK
jgi:adenylate cyclase